MNPSVITPLAPSTVPSAAPGDGRRARLLAEVTLAGRVIATSRPLGAFVGLNPLSGLEDQAWADAAAVAERALGVRTTLHETVFREAFGAGRIAAADLRAAVAAHVPSAAGVLDVAGREVARRELIIDDLLHGPVDPSPARRRRTLAEALAPRAAAQIDRRAARWCAAYADEGQAGWAMPRRELGLYGAWRAIGAHEPGAPSVLRRALRSAPRDAADAALAALDALGVPDAEIRAYLETHLATQPGWASHLRWRELEGRGAGLIDLLAIRLVQEAALLGPSAWRPSLVAPLAAGGVIPARDRAAHLLTRWGLGTTRAADLDAVAAVLDGIAGRRGLIWQEAYEAGYRHALLAKLDRAPAADRRATAAAQLVFCIDPRSEGLRRHLEAVGAYETFGFAGFFGIPMAFAPAGATQAEAHCPVPVAPTVELREQPEPGAEPRAARRQRRRRGWASAVHAAHAGGVSAFTLAEVGGLLAAPVAAARTLAPVAASRVGRIAEGGAAPTRVSIAGLPLADRIGMAEGILRGIGLLDGFAPLLVFCGHGSQTANNPYASALDCGACGGHGGAPNARAAAELLNDPEVRAGLAERGIELPDGTRAVAALHETTADVLTLRDVEPGADAALAALHADLMDAARALAGERAASLPGAAPQDRGADWAQVFPEWGLAGNAALIVAPRAATEGVDLERRTFLHSYHAPTDPSGAVLEQILTAPLVVAHGLNAQYYASAVDPLHLGSGTKAVHNVVGGIGVTAAAGGDLLQGLPWQSVADGSQLVHEPLRLLVLVEAPLDRIAEIVARHGDVRRLVDGEWIRLLARPAPGEPWQRLQDGHWIPADPPSTSSTSPTSTLEPHHEGAR